MFTFVILLVFAAGFLAVWAVNLVLTDLFPTDRKEVAKRLHDESRQKQRLRAREGTLSRDVSQFAYDPFEENQAEPNLYARLKVFVEQSGMNINAQRLLIIAAGMGFGMAALFWLLMGTIGAILGFAIGAGLPFMYVSSKRNRRMEKLLSQIPDTFDLMSRIIRAGQTIAQSMQSVADEFEPPIAEEFGYCYEQQNLGLDAETALRDLSRRTGLLEMKIFVLSVLVHRQTGGNLAELLDKLAALVRDRYRIRGLIKTLTAEGRVQAGVLMALPFAMYLAMFALNRSYALMLFDHPWLPIGSLFSLGLGWLWVRSIVNFDV